MGYSMKKSLFLILNLSISMMGLVACFDEDQSQTQPTTNTETQSTNVTTSASNAADLSVIPSILMTTEERATGFKFVGTEPIKTDLAPGDVYLRCENAKLQSGRYFILSKE